MDIIDNLHRAILLVQWHSRKAKLETGLTGPQLWAIKIIADAAPIKVSDIASRMYLHPATVGGILDRLEVRNLVARARSMEDRRVVYVDLTELGREMVSKAPEIVQGMMVGGLEVLSNKQFSCIEEGIAQVVRILGAESITSNPLHSEESIKERPVKKDYPHY